MINTAYSVDCQNCGGRGVVFFGDNYDYSIEPCVCVKDDVE